MYLCRALRKSDFEAFAKIAHGVNHATQTSHPDLYCEYFEFLKFPTRIGCLLIDESGESNPVALSCGAVVPLEICRWILENGHEVIWRNFYCNSSMLARLNRCCDTKFGLIYLANSVRADHGDPFGVLSVVTEAFQSIVYGFPIEMIVTQAWTHQARFELSAYGFRHLSNTLDFPPPYSFADASSAITSGNVSLGRIMNAKPTVLKLSEIEKRTVSLAMAELSDVDLAAWFGVELVTIRKRWESISRKVETIVGGVNRLSKGVRGPDKRQYLLSILRANPFEWKHVDFLMELNAFRTESDAAGQVATMN